MASSVTPAEQAGSTKMTTANQIVPSSLEEKGKNAAVPTAGQSSATPTSSSAVAVSSNNAIPPDGVLDSFLLTALSNPRDRMTILKLDFELERFMRDNRLNRLEFPPMTSYQRLLVHRVAQYFRLDHTVAESDEKSKRPIFLFKTPQSRIPVLRFSDLVEQQDDAPAKNVKIMKRATSESEKQKAATHATQPPILMHMLKKPAKDAGSSAAPHTPTALSSSHSAPISSHPNTDVIASALPVSSGATHPPSSGNKTLEEREQDYARARARIFSTGSSSSSEEPSSASSSSASSSSTTPPSTPPKEEAPVAQATPLPAAVSTHQLPSPPAPGSAATIGTSQQTHTTANTASNPSAATISLTTSAPLSNANMIAHRRSNSGSQNVSGSNSSPSGSTLNPNTRHHRKKSSSGGMDKSAIGPSPAPLSPAMMPYMIPPPPPSGYWDHTAVPPPSPEGFYLDPQQLYYHHHSMMHHPQLPHQPPYVAPPPPLPHTIPPHHPQHAAAMENYYYHSAVALSRNFSSPDLGALAAMGPPQMYMMPPPALMRGSQERKPMSPRTSAPQNTPPTANAAPPNSSQPASAGLTKSNEALPTASSGSNDTGTSSTHTRTGSASPPAPAPKLVAYDPTTPPTLLASIPPAAAATALLPTPPAAAPPAVYITSEQQNYLYNMNMNPYGYAPPPGAVYPHPAMLAGPPYAAVPYKPQPPISSTDYERRPPVKSAELFDPKAPRLPSSGNMQPDTSPGHRRGASMDSQHHHLQQQQQQHPQYLQQQPQQLYARREDKSNSNNKQQKQRPASTVLAKSAGASPSTSSSSLHLSTNSASAAPSPTSSPSGSAIGSVASLMFDYSNASTTGTNESTSASSPSHILEVCKPHEKIRPEEIDSLCAEVKHAGSTIKLLDDGTAIAIFKNSAQAKTALAKIRSQQFTLRPWVPAVVVVETPPSTAPGSSSSSAHQGSGASSAESASPAITSARTSESGVAVVPPDQPAHNS